MNNANSNYGDSNIKKITSQLQSLMLLAQAY